MKNILITLALVAAAGVAQAQTASPPGGATMPRDSDVKSTPDQGHLNPPTMSAGEAAAKAQIEAKGFNGVKGLKRDMSGTWTGLAMMNNQEVAVTLDASGNISSK